MEAKASYRDFVERLSGLSHFSQDDPIQLHAELHKHREGFLDLLKFKGPSAESRQQISSQYLENTSFGPQQLDNEDTRLALLLSNELKLDEIFCVELLITAKLERGEVTAEAAAGIFFEERRGIINSLLHLLELHAFELCNALQGRMLPIPQHIQVSLDFTQGLLRESGEAGQDRIAARLVELIRDNTLDLPPGSGLTYVKDENGALVGRTQALQAERVALCRCLLYASYVKQRVNPAVAGDTLALLGSLCMKLRGEEGKHLLMQQQVYLVLLAAVQFLLPGGDLGVQERSAMREFANNASLKQRVEQVGQGDVHYGAIVSLAWGILQGSLQMQAGPGAGAGDLVKTSLEAAVSGGVYSTIKRLVEAWYFTCEELEHQHLCAHILYTLLTDFLRLDETHNRHEIQKLLAHNTLHRPSPSNSLPAPPTSSASGALVLFNGNGIGNGSALVQPDHLGSLLSAFAAVLGVNPDVAYPNADRWACTGRLISRITSEHPDTQNVMQRSAEVRVPYVEMLAALASGEQGASLVMKQMREYAKPSAGPASQVLTWRRFFITIVEYCVRYFQLRVAGPGARPGLANEQQRLMNSQDAAAIVAHLKLFRRIMEKGNEVEVQAWIDSLERELSTQLNSAPLYEPLFQLMCHPVPNTVKAALDEALSAFARRKDYAAQLLERFLQCVTDGVNPDISHIMAQLSEVEARNEIFPETIALLDLMNKLVEAVMGSVVDSAQLSFFTEFVITHILGHLWRRGYREPEQKWQVASRSFHHLQLTLEMLDAAGAVSQHQLDRKPPGLVAMMDILSGGHAMQAVLHVLEPGFEELESTRWTSGEAPHREAAVTAALRLLVACLERDEGLVEDLGQFAGRGQILHPLDAQLRPPFIPRLTSICKYVCYLHNEELQLEAIKLGSLLAKRMPNLVELLQGPDFSMTACWEIRDGFTAALRQSLLAPARVVEDIEEGAPVDEEAITDARASAVIRLMLDSLDSPAVPSISHLLMGYDCEARGGTVEESVLLPLREFSCLRVVLEVIRAENLRISQLRPKLFSQCLQILFALADSSITGPAMLELLANQDGNMGFDMLPVLRNVLAHALPEARPALIATLQQHCWILKVLAKRLLTGTDTDGSDAVLLELFDMQGRLLMTQTFPDEAASPSINVLTILKTLTNVQVSQPVYSHVITQQHRRLLADMVVDDISIDAMLTNDMMMARAGLCTSSEFGDTIFDFEQLKRLLKQRYDDYLARSGQPGAASEMALSAVRSAFTYAQQFNAYVMTVGAQAAALEAWRQLVEVAFSKRYNSVCAVFPSGQLELLYNILVGALEVIRHLVVSTSSLAQELVRLVCLLLGRLQDQAAGSTGIQGLTGAGADALASVRVPARCAVLLKLLLEVGRAGQGVPAVRWQVYEALLKYLQFCSGPKLSRSPPAVLEALLQGYGQGGNVAQLDMSQTELEVSNGRLLRDYAPQLIQMLYKDSRDQGATKLALAVVFRVFAALVAADDTRAISARLHDKQPTSVAEAVLKDVVEHAEEVMLLPASKSQRALYVVEAQLELLVLLAQAVCQPGSFASLGGPTSGEALISFALACIRMLADCRALDTAPEALEGGQLRPTSVRYRLSHMVCPGLQLVLCITAALSSSREIKQQACQFVDAHSTLMLRLLRESATGAKSAAPADSELRQVELATSLVAHLAMALSDETFMPDQMKALSIKRAMFELATLFCCQSSHSRSPIVHRMMHADDGAAGVKHERFKSRVISLRCSIIQYLRQVVDLPRNPEVFICVGKGGDPRVDSRADGSVRPTLLLLHETARQAGSDLRTGLTRLSRLLQLLAAREGEMGEEMVAQMLQEYCPPQLLSTCVNAGLPAQRALLRQSMVSVASALDRQLGRLLHLAETSLAIVLKHLVTFLPKPFLPASDMAGAGSNAMVIAGPSANGRGLGGWKVTGPEDPQRLGSEQDLRYFADKLKSTITELEDLISRAGTVPGHSLKDLDSIVHNLKRYLVHY